MNFPRFWAMGQAISSRGRRPFESWGWSNESPEEAKRRGEENARKVAERFASTGNLDHRGYYGDRPFREEILETIADGNAVITRNTYGCEVLNTAGVMFIDVDLETGNNDSDQSWWSRFLGQQPSPTPPKDEQIIIDRAREWVERNAGWGWRAYRTRAGLRFVATHALFDPEAMAVSPLFDTLTADPLYRKLCRTQKCFRARLTPKPWRCGFGALTIPWPWRNEKAEKRFSKWHKDYQKAAAEYCTCELVATLGNPEMHSEIMPIIHVHDAKSKVGSGLPLA